MDKTIIAEIPPDQWAVVVAPEFLALLSGAYMAGFARDGSITLRYTDDTREIALLPVEDAQRLYDGTQDETANAGWMDLVGQVQRRPAPSARRDTADETQAEG